MTEQQKLHAAEVLLGTKALTGGDEPKFLPKIYVVNGECSLFLNAARRLAYGTTYPIEVMTIEEAWDIVHAKDGQKFDPNEVEDNFDSVGSTFDGKLFCDNPFINAGMVQNPVIRIADAKEDPDAAQDSEINRMRLSVRAQNVLTRMGIRTYRDLIKFGREPLLKVRNVGKTTIFEFDDEMDRAGLGRFWR